MCMSQTTFFLSKYKQDRKFQHTVYLNYEQQSATGGRMQFQSYTNVDLIITF